MKFGRGSLGLIQRTVMTGAGEASATASGPFIVSALKQGKIASFDNFCILTVIYQLILQTSER